MKILVSALEHSANVHLKSLKQELSEDVEFIGITCILTDIDKFHSKPCLFQGYIMLKDKLSFPQ